MAKAGATQAAKCQGGSGDTRVSLKLLLLKNTQIMYPLAEYAINNAMFHELVNSKN
jgi:hypothetical protein